MHHDQHEDRQDPDPVPACLLSLKSQGLVVGRHGDSTLIAAPRPLSPHSDLDSLSSAMLRRYLVDVGCGDYRSGSMPWLFWVYAQRGILFDRVFGALSDVPIVTKCPAEACQGCHSLCWWSCRRYGSLDFRGTLWSVTDRGQMRVTEIDSVADEDAVSCRLGSQAAALGRILGHHPRRSQARAHLVQCASRCRRQLVLQPAEHDQARICACNQVVAGRAPKTSRS